jgi:hypothetical protein
MSTKEAPFTYREFLSANSSGPKKDPKIAKRPPNPANISSSAGKVRLQEQFQVKESYPRLDI